MAKSYREVMREHRLRFSQQILDRWERKELKSLVDYVFKRVAACLILASIFLVIYKF